MAINVQGLQGHWNEMKGELKKRWGQLTDDDLKWGEGNIDQIVGKIQHRTGETRDQIERYLDQLTSRGGSMVSSAVESVGSYARDVSHRLQDHYGELSDQAHEGYQTAREMVVRNPMPWIAAAFGVGVLMGVVLGSGIGAHEKPSRRFF